MLDSFRHAYYERDVNIVSKLFKIKYLKRHYYNVYIFY